MKTIILLTIGFAFVNVLAYHDPDLNYHLSQLQQTQPCNDQSHAGYSYLPPSVQLTTPVLSKPSNAYLPVAAPPNSFLPSLQSSTYNTGTSYQAPAIVQTQTQKEFHGYATSPGLSAVGSAPKTVTPLATYAQAPIIAKITAAPLIAKFALAPSKTSYVAQSYGQQSYSTSHNSGPVVTQVFTAPTAKYAVSPALQQQRYTTVPQQVNQYSQVSAISGLTPVAHVPGYQYGSSSVHVSAPNVQYGAPVNHYSAPVVSQQYGVNAVSQYAVPPVAQYGVQAVSQYAAPVQHGAQISQYYGGGSQYSSSGLVASNHISSPAVSVSAPFVPIAHSAPIAHVSAGGVKNVHTDFVENYDAHPRYSYEYKVHDPHTGDIKHQKEERDGEVVKGQYSLVEPDGSVRTVEYVADWETGFHAAVRNSRDQH